MVDKRVLAHVSSRTAPMRVVRIPFLTPGELTRLHRAYPDIIVFAPVKSRHSDAPIRNPNNPDQRTDQMGLSHFSRGYSSARWWVPEVRSWEAKMRK